MILVVADTIGQVEQVVTLGGSEALAQIYRNEGRRAFMVDEIPAGPFYAGEGDVLLARPLIEIGDLDLEIGKAATVRVGARPASVSAFFQGSPAGTESVANGEWSIEVDQPGSYTFVFTAEFPYAPTLVMKVAA
jgi:hypothetical protein